MTDNKKLLEAAWTIKEHCEHTEEGGLCPFAQDGVCRTYSNCGFSALPIAHWKIKKPCRWTKEDYELAKKMISIGFRSFYRMEYGIEVAMGNDIIARPFDGAFENVFKSLQLDKAIFLNEIIKEYEESEKEYGCF